MWQTSGTPGTAGYQTNGERIPFKSSAEILRPVEMLDAAGQNYLLGDGVTPNPAFSGNIIRLVYSEAVPGGTTVGAYLVTRSLPGAAHIFFARAGRAGAASARPRLLGDPGSSLYMSSSLSSGSCPGDPRCCLTHRVLPVISVNHAYETCPVGRGQGQVHGPVSPRIRGQGTDGELRFMRAKKSTVVLRPGPRNTALGICRRKSHQKKWGTRVPQCCTVSYGPIEGKIGCPSISQR